MAFDTQRAANITFQMARLMNSYQPIFQDAPAEYRARYSTILGDIRGLNEDLRTVSEGGDSNE